MDKYLFIFLFTKYYVITIRITVNASKFEQFQNVNMYKNKISNFPFNAVKFLNEVVLINWVRKICASNFLNCLKNLYVEQFDSPDGIVQHLC